MRYLVDSDWVIDFLTGKPETRVTLTLLRSEGLALSAITYMEVYEGAFSSRDPNRAEAGLLAWLQDVTLLPVDQHVALTAARMRSRLRKQRRHLTHRALDLVIAATAITYGLTLLTRNRKDFADIPDLLLFEEP